MENKIYQHSYNLIQNFYIIGITKKNNTLVSKILSRFPQVELPYMNVDDEIIINVRKKNHIAYNHNTIYSIVFLMGYI